MLVQWDDGCGRLTRPLNTSYMSQSSLHVSLSWQNTRQAQRMLTACHNFHSTTNFVEKLRTQGARLISFSVIPAGNDVLPGRVNPVIQELFLLKAKPGVRSMKKTLANLSKEDPKQRSSISRT